MKQRILPLSVLTGLIVLLSLNLITAADKPVSSPDKAARIEWLAFDKGMAALVADTTGKHMFIDITASWCGWCKKMDRETFADPAVVAEIQANFVPVKLWGDSNKMLDIDGYKITEKNLAAGEFKASGYPTFMFLTPEQAKLNIGRNSGFRKADRLLTELTFVSSLAYVAQMTTDDPTQKTETKSTDNK